MPSDSPRRRSFTGSVIYDLPFGRNGLWLRDGWAAKAAGGFELSGILTMQNGFPFTINLKGDTANVGAGTGGIYVRPNVVGTSQYLPSSQQSTSEWFNTADFVSAACSDACNNTTSIQVKIRRNIGTLIPTNKPTQ